MLDVSWPVLNYVAKDININLASGLAEVKKNCFTEVTEHNARAHHIRQRNISFRGILL